MVRIDANGRWTDDLPEDWFSRAHEILRPGEGIGDAITVAQLRYGLDSPEWFAATILQATNRVREVIARGETASAAHLALQLGIEMVIAWFKMTWESDTLTGKKIHAAVSHGGYQLARTNEKPCSSAMPTGNTLPKTCGTRTRHCRFRLWRALWESSSA